MVLYHLVVVLYHLVVVLYHLVVVLVFGGGVVQSLSLLPVASLGSQESDGEVVRVIINPENINPEKIETTRITMDTLSKTMRFDPILSPIARNISYLIIS